MGRAILCPKHGELQKPYRSTVIHIGRSDVADVMCAFCEQCNVYYTTAMAINLGKADMINGRPVIKGKTVNFALKKDRDDTYPRIITEKERLFQQKQKKLSVTAQPFTAAPKAKPKKYTPDVFASASKQSPDITENYILTDRECVNQLICPNCASRLSEKQYNVPVYDIDQNFIAYYSQNLWYCHSCRNIYMTESIYSKIQKRMEAKKKHISPANVRLSYNTYDHTYAYDPIAGFELYFERTENRVATAAQIYTLANSSFLGDEGYSIRLQDTERHQILRAAVNKYGHRRVAEHLRFLISTREAQRDGITKYAKAISIWQDDLNYVAKI